MQSSEGEKEAPLVVVEDEGKGGGFGDKGRENHCWYDVEDMVNGKGMGSNKDQLGAVNFDFIFSLWTGYFKQCQIM